MTAPNLKIEASGEIAPGDLDEMAHRAQEASEFLKALAHESRLLILCFLADGERSVGELEQLLALRQPTVSQQLARLRMDRLVTSRRDGKTIYYSLANERVRLVIGALAKAFCGPAPCDSGTERCG